MRSWSSGSTRPAIALGILTFALATCTSVSGDPDARPKGGSREKTSPTTLIGLGADIENNVDARADVQITRCSRAGKRAWRVEATATNPTDDPVHYELALRITRADDGSVVGRDAVATDQVAPEESMPVGVTTWLEERVGQKAKVNCIFVSINRESG